MNNIVNTNKAVELSRRIKNQGKKIVMAGGCFDIIHVGHLKFLKNAKKRGDVLFILLESDESVRKLKGPNRPYNSQKDRAEILSALKPVDYVVILENMKKNQDYDRLIGQIRPDVFAVTKNDPGNAHKKRQAELFGGTVKEVILRIENYSTTIVKNKLKYE